VLQGDEKARSRSRGFGSPGGSIASTEKLVHRKEDVGLSCFVGLHSRKLSESRRWESVYSLPNMETSFFQSRGLTADKTSSNRKSHRHLSPEILSAGMSYQQEFFLGPEVISHGRANHIAVPHQTTDLRVILHQIPGRRPRSLGNLHPVGTWPAGGRSIRTHLPILFLCFVSALSLDFPRGPHTVS